jgi:hypothetical protein
VKGADKFDSAAYEAKLVSAYKDSDRHNVILERWKNVMDGKFTGVLSSLNTRNKTIDNIISDISQTLDYRNWSFDPEALLTSEKTLIESTSSVQNSGLLQILQLMPGKQLRAIAANNVGLDVSSYTDLIISTVNNPDTTHQTLCEELEAALAPHLPLRSSS